MAIGNAIGIPFKLRSRSWTPQSALGGETPSFWYKEGTRSDLTLTNSVTPGTNDASILLPYLNKPTGDEYASISDNGALDIRANDTTFYMRVKGETASNPATKFGLGGKSIPGSVQGRYGFSCLANSFYRFTVQPSGGAVEVVSEVLHTDQAWHLLIGEIDQAASVIRMWIDDVKIGDDVAYTGSFPAMDNAYKFYIGAEQYITTGAVRYQTKSSFGDCGLLFRKLTATEKTNLFNGIIPSGHKAYWPLNDIYLNDCSGNGYTLTGTNITAAKIKYGNKGSKHGLNVGYSLYQGITANVLTSVYVYYKDNGTALATPSVPAGYAKVVDRAGSLIDHNLSDSYINIPITTWDRSNVTNFHAVARLGKYDSGNVDAWHITELKQSELNNMGNENYQGLNYVKGDDGSINRMTLLKEIFSYATNKTAADLRKALMYTGNLTDWNFIDFYFDDEYICAQEGSKHLKFITNRYLRYYESDILIRTLDLNGVVNSIQYAKIFPNGNILFCSQTKAYYSDDNLVTYQESTVLDVDGNAFVPAATNNFWAMNSWGTMPTVGGVYLLVFGNYATDVGIEGVEINAWYTIDNGATIKSFYRVNDTEPVLAFRHFHGITYNPEDGDFYMYTGDGNGGASDCRILKAVYDWDLDTWAVTEIVNGLISDLSMLIGITFYDGNAILGGHSNASTRYGIYKVATTDLNDLTKYYKIVNSADNNSTSFGDDEGIIFVCLVRKKELFASKNYGATFIKHYLTGGDPITGNGGFFACSMKNSNGYYCMQQYVDGEALTDFFRGQVVMVKIT